MSVLSLKSPNSLETNQAVEYLCENPINCLISTDFSSRASFAEQKMEQKCGNEQFVLFAFIFRLCYFRKREIHLKPFVHSQSLCGSRIKKERFFFVERKTDYDSMKGNSSQFVSKIQILEEIQMHP